MFVLYSTRLLTLRQRRHAQRCTEHRTVFRRIERQHRDIVRRRSRQTSERVAVGGNVRHKRTILIYIVTANCSVIGRGCPTHREAGPEGTLGTTTSSRLTVNAVLAADLLPAASRAITVIVLLEPHPACAKRAGHRLSRKPEPADQLPFIPDKNNEPLNHIDLEMTNTYPINISSLSDTLLTHDSKTTYVYGR